MSDLGETDPVKGALQIAIFLLAFALAPIFVAPISEIYGRRPVISGGNIVFALFCLGAGFCKTSAQLAVCRFFSGVGGSASVAVYGGVLADVWDIAGRARASAVLGSALLLGPVLGPSCGGWMSERASWRWTCWVPAMAAAALELIAVFAYHETYAPAILGRKYRRAVKTRPGTYTVLQVEEEPRNLTLESLVRPLVYLFTDPALFLQSLYYAFVFGVLYLVVVTFQSVFGEGYGQSPGIVGMDLIAEGGGAILGMIISTIVLEKIYKRQKKKARYEPESRLLSAMLGAVLVSAGLFVYGFTALKTHFMVPVIGVGIFACGSTNTYLAMQLYIIDCFDYSASAIAGLSVLRCLFAAVFPLFGQRLFDRLGVDWGVGLLAFLTIALGGPFIPLLYFFGPTLRAVGAKNRNIRRA